MDLFDLYATINIRLDDFERGLSDAQSKFKSFSDSLSKASSSVGDVLKPLADGFKAVEGVGKTAMDGITTAMTGFAAAATTVAGFGAAAVKSGMAFDSTMSEVSAISGATGDDFQALRDKALEMGASTKFSASEAASAMTYMGMAGWKTQDMLDGIAGIMNLAAASGEDLAVASDIVTDALTAFGLSASDSGHFADILAAASSNANTNVSMMGETFKYAAPIAGALGFSAEDTAIAIGLMGNAGIKASQAGTSLRTIMNSLSGVVKVCGKNIGEVDIQTTNADGSMRSLSDILADCRVAFSGLTESESAAAAELLVGKNAMSGFLALMNAAPEDVNKLTDAIYNCNGAAEEMSAIMMDNLQGDLTLLGSAFESLQIAISDSLTPTLREFAQFGQKAMVSLLEGFQGDGVKGFMSALSGVVTEGTRMLAEKAPEFASVSLQFVESLASGLLSNRLLFLQTAYQVIDETIAGLDAWISANSSELVKAGFNIVDTIFHAFNEAGDIISKYIGDFVPVIADAFLSYHDSLFTIGLDILGAIGTGIIENKGEIQFIAAETIQHMVESLRDNAPMIIDGGIALLEALVGAITENLPLIVETGAEIVGRLIVGISTASPGVQAIIAASVLPHILKIGETALSVADTAVKGFDLIKSAIEKIPGAVETVQSVIGKIPAVIDTVKTGFSALWGVLTANPIALVVAAIAALVAGFIYLWNTSDEFREFWINLWEKIKEAASAAWEAITGFFMDAWDAIQAAWNGAGEFFGSIVDGIKSAFDGVGEFLGGLFSAAWDAIQSVWNGAVDFFSGVFEGIQAVFSSVGEILVGFFSNAWDAVKTAWEGAKEFFSGIADGIHSAFETATEFLGSAFSTAWETISGVWSSAVDFFSGIWSGITDTFSEVSDWLGGVFSDAWDAVNASWDGAVSFFSDIWQQVKDVFSDVWDKFLEIGGNIVNGIKEGISGAWDALKSWVKEKFDGLVGGVKDLLGIHSPSAVFADIGKNMMAGMESGIDSGMAGLAESAQSAASAVTDAFGDLPEETDAIGAMSMLALQSSMASKHVEIMAESSKAAAVAKAGLDNLANEFSGIGTNAMSSLSNSMSIGIQTLENKVRSLMQSIASAAKAALGIHSPSKVFAGIGENMALGLGEGWDDEYASIKRQIESGLNFGTASVGLSASGSGWNGGNDWSGPQSGFGGMGGNTTNINIYNPVKEDSLTQARNLKKMAQQMALGY